MGAAYLHLQAVMTHEEIGRRLGISKQAVQQAERRALRKLRELPEAIELWDVVRRLSCDGEYTVIADREGD